MPFFIIVIIIVKTLGDFTSIFSMLKWNPISCITCLYSAYT